MIAIAFALSSSLLYGTADFLGGFATKRLSVFVVAPISKLFAAIIITCVSFAYSPFSIASGDWPWLILAAFSTVSAICCLYHALANGKMSVVAPLTGGCAIMLPALVSVLLGEVPSFWQIVGLLCAYLSIYRVSRPERMAPLAGATAIPRPSHLKELLAPANLTACAAGLSIGVFYISFQFVDSASGLWPLALTRILGVLLLSGYLALPLRKPNDSAPPPPLATYSIAAGSGMLDGLANIFYVLALDAGDLVVAATLTSLYPATTMLLAAALLKERLRSHHILGLLFLAAASGAFALAKG